MDDSDFGFGVVYLIENAYQFWSGECLHYFFVLPAKCRPIELEDILHLPTDPTLPRLDSTLKSFTSLCASYHGTLFHACRLSCGWLRLQHATEQYLQTSIQLEHACELLLQSELFAFHSERMCNIMVDQVQKVCNRRAVAKID